MVFLQTLHLQLSPFSFKKKIMQKAKLVSQRDPSLAVLIKSATAAWENTNYREKNIPGLSCHYSPGLIQEAIYIYKVKIDYFFYPSIYFLSLTINFLPAMKVR